MKDYKEIRAGIVERQITENNIINVKYPEVFGLKDESVQRQINNLIRKLVERLMSEQGLGQENLEHMLGSYQVALNEKGILSIKFENYSYFQGAAHGLTIIRSLTVNLDNGEALQLSDLFKRNSPYRVVVSNIIKEEVKKRDLPLIAEFKGINDNQVFYLTPTALVIYWQAYQYTPFSAGLPEFSIPYAILANLIDPEGPLGRFISSVSKTKQ